MKYKTTKIIDLPQFIKFEVEGKNIKMMLSDQRTFTYNKNGDTFELDENECFYKTIYGWGVIVDIYTLKVRKNEQDIFSDMDIIEITKGEYGNGVW